ncbi:MAG: SDR family NAD(P)-dependent oxidoreductase [Caulobacter sp.]
MKFVAGQVAVVTGGASGIGLALVRALAARGLQVCLVDVESPALGEAVIRLRQAGLTVEPFLADVADATGMTALARVILERHGGVDLLVNNAGVGGLLSPIWASPLEDWAWVTGVNLLGVVNGIRAFVPAMVERGSGHVLNMASLAGLSSPPFMGPYVATKHAVVALTECLDAEFAITGAPLKASVACPGNVESRIRAADRNRPEALKATSSASPEMLARLDRVFDSVRSQGMITADAAADRIIAGLEADRLHILTHPDDQGPVRERLARVQVALADAA